MFFLLRVAFWIIVALALLPTGSSQPTAQAARFGTTDAVLAATATVSDMSAFCERQPEACKVGAQAAVVIGQRAQAGAKMVYEFISDRVVRGDGDHDATTGSVVKPQGPAQRLTGPEPSCVPVAGMVFPSTSPAVHPIYRP
jgi:hypothetical protein